MNESYFIGPNATIQRAMELLNDTQGMGLIVVDDNKNLLGTLTDGDVRRALLKGLGLGEVVRFAMCSNPLICRSLDERDRVCEEAKRKLLKIIPEVDSENKVINVLFVDRQTDLNNIPVVIMAGGLGTRLGELTKDCPKPMLKIGDKPVLELIIERLLNQGFSNFYISVNYKAEVIEDYFGDGSKFNCKINYLREDKRLGTAGALSLLPKGINEPIVVMNGDVLTKVDFRNLREFHYLHESPLTISVRKYDFKVPYGVINIEDHSVVSLDEKPTQSFFVNAGVYVINSKLLEHIPLNEFYDMTTFVEDVMAKDINVLCFPIVEKWIDIGQVDDLNYAREEHSSATL